MENKVTMEDRIFCSPSGKLGFKLSNYIGHTVEILNSTVPVIRVTLKDQESFTVEKHVPYAYREEGYKDIDALKEFLMENKYSGLGEETI